MKIQIKRSFGIVGLAVMSGIMMIGSGLVYAVNVPTQDPQTSAGVAPTFTGVQINGITDLRGQISNNNIVNGIDQPMLINDTLGILGVSNILGVQGILKVVTKAVFFGPISNDATTGEQDVVVDDSLDVRREIKNDGTDNAGTQLPVRINDELDVTGAIENSSVIGQVDDPRRMVTINDNLNVKGDGSALEISTFEDDVVIGKGLLIGTGFRVGVTPAAGGFVQTGGAILGNLYVGYDPNTGDVAPSNLDIWGNIVRTQSNNGQAWPVTIDDDLKVTNKLEVNGLTDTKGGLINSTIVTGVGIPLPGLQVPLSIFDDLVIGTDAENHSFQVNGRTFLKNTQIGSPIPSLYKILKMYGDIQITGNIMNPLTQSLWIPGGTSYQSCTSICPRPSSIPAGQWSGMTEAERNGYCRDTDTFQISCTTQSNSLGGMVEVPKPVNVLNGLNIKNGSLIFEDTAPSNPMPTGIMYQTPGGLTMSTSGGTLLMNGATTINGNLNVTNNGNANIAGGLTIGGNFATSSVSATTNISAGNKIIAPNIGTYLLVTNTATVSGNNGSYLYTYENHPQAVSCPANYKVLSCNVIASGAQNAFLYYLKWSIYPNSSSDTVTGAPGNSCNLKLVNTNQNRTGQYSVNAQALCYNPNI